MWPHLLDQFHLDADICLRLALACIAGFLLGAERERHGRAAGLRTTLLVTVAACLLMVISEYYYVRTYDFLAAGQNSWRPDPTRLAAGALSGMGFLGAGVIIHERANVVRGVTTAASLWLASAIGLSFGAGMHGIGIICTLLAFVILYWLPRLEALIQDDWYTDFIVTVNTAACPIESLIDAIETIDVAVVGIDLRSRPIAHEQRARFHLKHKKSELKTLALSMTARINALPGVRETHWRD